MAVATVLLGLGATRIWSARDQVNALQIAAITILGMAVTYGIVCGSMMFAGEHEGGTLVFLDIFFGQRGMLWVAKALIGAALVMAQATAVGLVLTLLDQSPPAWVTVLVGHATAVDGAFAPGAAFAARGGALGASGWLSVLPVV